MLLRLYIVGQMPTHLPIRDQEPSRKPREGHQPLRILKTEVPRARPDALLVSRKIFRQAGETSGHAFSRFVNGLVDPTLRRRTVALVVTHGTSHSRYSLCVSRLWRCSEPLARKSRCHDAPFTQQNCCSPSHSCGHGHFTRYAAVNAAEAATCA